jgi:hypothetical protein
VKMAGVNGKPGGVPVHELANDQHTGEKAMVLVQRWDRGIALDQPAHAARVAPEVNAVYQHPQHGDGPEIREDVP